MGDVGDEFLPHPHEPGHFADVVKDRHGEHVMDGLSGLMNCTLRIMSGRGSTSNVMSRGLSCGAESSSSSACWISAAGMTSTGNLPSASLACGEQGARGGLQLTAPFRR